MTTPSDADAAILAEIDAAFGSVERPKHFTIEDGDPECMDHDRLLHSNTPQTLKREEVDNICYNPWTECLPEGIAYYFPALVRFTLNAPDDKLGDWMGSILIRKLYSGRPENAVHRHFNPTQRKAVVNFLEFLAENRAELARRNYYYEELIKCLEQWKTLSSEAESGS